MNIFHKKLKDRWCNFSLTEQLANIGSEVGRAISWRNKNNNKMSRNALYRALELIDFTVEDKKNINSLKEILRMREILVDYFMGKNIYKSTDQDWEKYFYYFNLASRHRV
jgi:hypothetical protein